MEFYSWKIAVEVAPGQEAPQYSHIAVHSDAHAIVSYPDAVMLPWGPKSPDPDDFRDVGGGPQFFDHPLNPPTGGSISRSAEVTVESTVESNLHAIPAESSSLLPS